jgi:uroporphyrinogen-III synthase
MRAVPAKSRARPLQKLGILVTRPARQAENLCRLIEAQGGTPIRFPTIEILPPRNPDNVDTVVEQLAHYDMALFVSANAVDRAMTLIERRAGGLPARLRIGAIGKGTARALRYCRVPVHLIPERFNSEALLAMPEMQALAGRRIAIFRGEGGRDLLGDTLKARGARVNYAEVYRRGRPDRSPGNLLKRWAAGEIHAVVVTSNESLRNLFDIVGKLGQHWLYHTPLIAVSERARELARELGFARSPLVAREASDEAIVETLLRWRRNRFD